MTWTDLIAMLDDEWDVSRAGEGRVTVDVDTGWQLRSVSIRREIMPIDTECVVVDCTVGLVHDMELR